MRGLFLYPYFFGGPIPILLILFEHLIFGKLVKKGAYGPYLRITFTITEKGELDHYRFSGLVKPTSLRQSKFYRWVRNIMGKDPGDMFCTQDMLGKKCIICLSRKNNYYSVKDVAMKSNV